MKHIIAIALLAASSLAVAQGSNAPDSPTAGTWCATENSTCQLPSGVTATVSYGIEGMFAVKDGQAGAISCSTQYFDRDPAQGAVKACYYKSASTTVTPPSTPASGPEVADLPKCWPKPVGTGTKLRTGASDAGAWAWWYCSNKVMYEPQFVVVSKLTYSSSTFFNDISTVLASPSPSTALNALWIAKVKKNPDISNDLYKSVGVDMFSGYTVPLNGTAATRPTYSATLLNGKLDPKVTGSVKVGAACYCNVWRYVEGRQYCAVTDSPSYQLSVSVCEPRLQ